MADNTGLDIKLVTHELEQGNKEILPFYLKLKGGSNSVDLKEVLNLIKTQNTEDRRQNKDVPELQIKIDNSASKALPEIPGPGPCKKGEPLNSIVLVKPWYLPDITLYTEGEARCVNGGQGL
jgi:hypothetical protein